MLEKIQYMDGEVPLTGWLSRPSANARAAVVIFPTIMNMTPAIERRAQRLADAGFVAMVADFYGEPVRDFAEAMEHSTRLRSNVDHYRRRLIAAIETLGRQEIAKELPLAAIGYCMGGQAALEIARAGLDLVLVASFHGLLDTERPASSSTPVRPRILVCHGDADPLVPRASVLAFWEEMDAAGAQWHFHSYSGVKHGFTDPDSGSRGLPALDYSASADRQSWAAFLSLTDEILRGG